MSWKKENNYGSIYDISICLNNKINSLHERALQITYGDRSSSFEKLLKKDNSVSIHHTYPSSIHYTSSSDWKVKNNIAPEILKELFAPKMSSYDLRNNSLFNRRRVNSAWHDTELVSYLGPKTWDLVPNEIKEPESLDGFKFKIKDGSLKDVHAHYANISWQSRVYNNIKTGF